MAADGVQAMGTSRGVFPVSLRGKAVEAYQVAVFTAAAGEFTLPAAQAVSADHEPRPELEGGAFGGFRADGDQAAAGVAVQGGAGAAQNLDAAGRAQVQVVELSLAVGHGERNAVEHDLQAAHSEGGADAQTARADAVSLGGVVTVGHEEAGHESQALFQGQPLCPALDFFPFHQSDRMRQPVERARHARGRDHGGRESVDGGVRGGGRLLGPGSCAEKQGQEYEERPLRPVGKNPLPSHWGSPGWVSSSHWRSSRVISSWPK